MNIPLQQPLQQELLHSKDLEFSKPLTDSSFCPSISLSKFILPLNELFSPFVSLVSGSHLSFPNCQPHPCNPHPIHFPMTSFHVPPAYHSRTTHCHILTRTWLLCPFQWLWQSITLNQPNYLFFCSCLWFTCYWWRRSLSHADAHLLQLIFPILHSLQHCPGNLFLIFNWLDFPFLL